MKSIETLLTTVAGGLLIAGIVSVLTGQYGIGISVALLLTGVILLAVSAVLSCWSARRRNRAKRALLSQVQSAIKIAHDEARIFHRKGMYRESLASIDRVLPRAQSDQEIFLLRSLRGNNLFMLESYDEAEREYNECYRVSDSIPNIRAKGICFLNLGITLTRRGLYTRALRPLEKALAVLEHQGTNFDIGKTQLNLGSWYIHTGDVDRGLEYLKKARPRVIASYSKDQIAMLLKNLGSRYREAGKPFWFMLFSQSAYHWYRMSGNKRGMADQLCNIGNAWKDLGRRDLATEMLQELVCLLLMTHCSCTSARASRLPIRQRCLLILSTYNSLMNLHVGRPYAGLITERSEAPQDKWVYGGVGDEVKVVDKSQVEDHIFTSRNLGIIFI